MALNKQKGNMYNWVTHTWNPIRGKCPHECNYCYMRPLWKRQKSEKQILDEKCLKDDLGSSNFIFVGSSTDMFSDKVPTEWIIKVLEHCNKFPNNTYLFQTKNPKRFFDFSTFPKKTIFGTTLETNWNHKFMLSKAPSPYIRFREIMKCMSDRTMISIEPIMDFDLDGFVEMLMVLQPKFVSIGADSKGCNLPEPTLEKVKKFIEKLEDFTEVKIKDNLKRLKEVKPNSSHD